MLQLSQSREKQRKGSEQWWLVWQHSSAISRQDALLPHFPQLPACWITAGCVLHVTVFTRKKKLRTSPHAWWKGRLWLRYCWLSLEKTNHRKSSNPSSTDQMRAVFLRFSSFLLSLFIVFILEQSNVLLKALKKNGTFFLSQIFIWYLLYSSFLYRLFAPSPCTALTAQGPPGPVTRRRPFGAQDPAAPPAPESGHCQRTPEQPPVPSREGLHVSNSST